MSTADFGDHDLKAAGEYFEISSEYQSKIGIELWDLERYFFKNNNKRDVSTVIDVGGGPGNLIIHIAEELNGQGLFVNVDPQPANAEFGRLEVERRNALRVNKKQPPIHILWLTTVAEAMSDIIGAGQFDVTLSVASALWFKDRDRAFSGMENISAQNGHVAIATSEKRKDDGHNHPQAIKEEFLSQDRYREYHHTGMAKRFSLADLTTQIAKTRLTGTTYMFDTSFHFENIEKFYRFLDLSSSRSFWKFGDIPEQEWPELEGNLRKRYLALCDESGAITMNVHCVFFISK